MDRPPHRDSDRPPFSRMESFGSLHEKAQYQKEEMMEQDPIVTELLTIGDSPVSENYQEQRERMLQNAIKLIKQMRATMLTVEEARRMARKP
jgi:hypothetical protein